MLPGEQCGVCETRIVKDAEGRGSFRRDGTDHEVRQAGCPVSWSECAVLLPRWAVGTVRDLCGVVPSWSN